MSVITSASTEYRFREDLASALRIVVAAEPERRMEQLRQCARELVRHFTVGSMPRQIVVDELHGLCIGAGMPEFAAQDIIADAVANPYVPPTATRISDRVANVQTAPPRSSTLIVRRASEIEPQPVRWLWQNRLPIGKLSIIAGDPGLGKSQLTCAIAATISKGGAWPCGEGAAPRGSVIILSAEDDAADTIRPRLDAAGADLERVFIISAVQDADGRGRRAFNLQADLANLECEIGRHGDVLLVIIDPVSSYLGKVDSHRNAELRAVLEPVGEMAGRLGVAVLTVTHFSKSNNGSANNRFIGSIAFVAAARAAHILVRDPNNKDRRLFLPTKSNVGPEGAGLAFRIEVMHIRDNIPAALIVWDGAAPMTAEEALASKSKSENAPSRGAAESFLLEILAAGALPTRQVQSEAKAAGIAWAAARRAKDVLGIIASKTALDGGWVWALPARAN